MTHSAELSRITEYDAGTVLDAGGDAQVSLDEDASEGPREMVIRSAAPPSPGETKNISDSDPQVHSLTTTPLQKGCRSNEGASH